MGLYYHNVWFSIVLALYLWVLGRWLAVDFFKDDNLDALYSVEEQVRTFISNQDEAGGAVDVHYFILLSIKAMIVGPRQFDGCCKFNISQIGSQFSSALARFDLNDRSSVEVVFFCCYRFVVEFQLVSPEGVSGSLKEAMYNINVDNLAMRSDTVHEIKYANHYMVINVVRGYLHHSDLVSLKELPRLLDRARNENQEYQLDYEQRKAQVDVLKSSLDSYRDGFNFVGLKKGFSDLKDSKNKEKKNSVVLMSLIVVLMLAPFVIKFLSFLHSGVGVFLGYDFYFVLLGFELLMMYMFRIVLQNFRSVQAQLLQIDLRMTLCQFVQSYAEYAQGVKSSDPDLLAKFEQVVSSNIVNSDEAIPSTFDGVEQLSKLVSSFKKV